MMSIVMYNIKFRMGNMIRRRLLMILFYILLREKLRNTGIISLLGIGRVRVGGLVD